MKCTSVSRVCELSILMPASNCILRVKEKIIGEVLNLLPELQEVLSLLEKVIRETQCVSTGIEIGMKEP